MNTPVYDVAIIGGGINGCGIARDAAGRGLSVFLCEQNDLASGTSSSSTKLIHGGLRYLEYYEFRLVREALTEREVLLRAAPHIIWPLRFILPHHKGLRPAWLIRLGLFLYDNLGGRKLLPGTTTVDLTTDEAGTPLKGDFSKGFEYSDCWVIDSRLVVLNAMDAVDHGAVIHTRTTCLGAIRENNLWTITLADGRTGEKRTIQAKALVNASGPWMDTTIATLEHKASKEHIRMVKGSHIIVKKIFNHSRAYIFQNADGRIIFAIPYEQDFTLIGTTDVDFHGDPSAVAITDDEINYLCQAASEYFTSPVTPESVVSSYSGIRPLFDDGKSDAKAATRDYVLKLESSNETAPLISIYGGKITTYRKLAESVLEKLSPYLPGMGHPWTADASMPGGDFAPDKFAGEVQRLMNGCPILSKTHATRLVRTYGTKALVMTRPLAKTEDMGVCFGGDLYEFEVKYLIRHEWAQTAADVLWRRTNLGLVLSSQEADVLQAWMEQQHQ
ncbi:glycerol-3-phosphate dehydrogenase [Desulfopila aestuarii]|uniref:Glycerol-3-phosphate dehydrogenase n=1 Tax=Desulfopila aestuarii DSM 18488 TaxID=1121416 RepID=A0A1M7Y9W7_9BACT|nr:glycerol-3-phosphate dehydrogenase [Desulfopila aestuarii]SHO49366.1 homodimeric glycerol 3-phosphate dehydrogenase (quinone) [Desulfopila aestuarii DSM 18488]